ncbi:flagellar basal-body MS-ring/collar protein FliF [Cellulomonas soli]
MPAQVQAALDRVTGAVKQFTLAQRTLALIGIAVLVLGAFALSSWVSRPTMSPLFSGLSGTDASAVVDQLTADGVSYELADGGSTVLVPADSLYAERIKLAAAGLPANADGGGYSLLDKMPMTSSEFQQQTTYQRALEGELAKTVGAIEGVEAATVQLAVPQETVFVSEKADPTASVFIRTRAGVELTTDQVQAIVHLVSAGIEGMKTTDVAVIDSTGKVLSAVGTGTTGLPGSDTNDYEARVTAAVQSLLDSVVGVGRSAVTVTAQVSTADSQKTVEEFSATPNTPPLASSTTKEQYTGSGSGAAGVLGPDNIAVPSTDGTGTYNSESTDLQNAVNKSTEVITQPAGAVARQSVAVVVDADAAAALDMAELTTTLAAAAGIDTARGDTIAVQRMAFDTTAATAAQEALEAADTAAAAAAQRDLIKQGAIAGGVLLVVIIAAIVLGRRSRRARREALDLGELQVDPVGDLLGMDDEDDLPVLPPAPVATADPLLLKRAEISALATEQPGEVADLLRGWLAGSGSGRR